MFSKYVYGRVPSQCSESDVDREHRGSRDDRLHAGDRQGSEGEVDNSSYPAIRVHIHMTLVMPAHAKGPVPVLMMFGRAGFPSPTSRAGGDLDKINKAWKAVLVQQDPSLKEVFAAASGLAAGQGNSIPVSAIE